MKKFAYFMATVVGLFSSLFAGTARAECAEGDGECGTNCCYHMSEVGNNDYIGMVYPDDEGEEAIFNQNVFSENQMIDIYFSEGITKITASPRGYGDNVGNVHLPNSLKEVDEGVLSTSTAYIISDNVDTTNWSQDAFLYDSSNPRIFCVGDQDACTAKISDFSCYGATSCVDNMEPISEEYCTGSNYQWIDEKCEYIGGDNSNNTGGSSNQVSCGEGQLEKNNGCVPASQGCGEGYRQIETWCNKIRWTPAEAAQVLTNDNNNTVTITFRK